MFRRYTRHRQQIDNFLCASTSAYRRTDLLTSSKIYKIQSLLFLPLQQIVSNFLVSATTKFQIKLKEYLQMTGEKPDLNKQVKNINLSLSL